LYYFAARVPISLTSSVRRGRRQISTSCQLRVSATVQDIEETADCLNRAGPGETAHRVAGQAKLPTDALQRAATVEEIVYVAVLCA
jgi:hypothetical protein